MKTPLTQHQLELIKHRLNQVPHGPWRADWGPKVRARGGDTFVHITPVDDDYDDKRVTDFFVHSWEDITALVETVELLMDKDKTQ